MSNASTLFGNQEGVRPEGSQGTLLITGASRGIGKAVARLAAARGYRLALTYQTQAAAARSVAEEIQSKGGKAEIFKADLTGQEDARQLFDWVDERFGSLDGLVYCAGRSMKRMPLLDTPSSEIDGQIAVNLVGPFHCLQQAAQRMARSRGGRGGAIVLISSEAARFGGRNISPYAAAKAGLNGLVLGAARELAEDGIRLNGVSPGVIDTDMVASEGEQAVAALVRTIPMGRLGEPEEVAEAALWLLSDAASYICGAILPVAGGR